MDKELKKDLDDIKRLLSGVILSIVTLAKMYQLEEKVLEESSFDSFLEQIEEIADPVDLMEEE